MRDGHIVVDGKMNRRWTTRFSRQVVKADTTIIMLPSLLLLLLMFQEATLFLFCCPTLHDE